MSRIQQILDKAEREGRMRRTTGLGEAAAPPGAPRPIVTALTSPVVGPPRPTEGRLHPLLVAAREPHSSIAEQYRSLRTRIAQMENGREYRALIVTSPAQGDGKTVTCLNLALAMAQEQHRRILLVDADLRAGSLHRLLGIPGQPGLSDVLLGTTSLEDAMVALPQYRLTVIPAGSAVDQPTELLGSGDMRRVVDVLRTQFDRIVFDTPPSSPLADVGVLAPLVDGVILVVRAGRTQRPAIDRAIEDLDPSRLVGLVLNDVEDRSEAYGYPQAGAPVEKRRWNHWRRTAEARPR